LLHTYEKESLNSDNQLP